MNEYFAWAPRVCGIPQVLSDIIRRFTESLGVKNPWKLEKRLNDYQDLSVVRVSLSDEYGPLFAICVLFSVAVDLLRSGIFACIRNYCSGSGSSKKWNSRLIKILFLILGKYFNKFKIQENLTLQACLYIGSILFGNHCSMQ